MRHRCPSCSKGDGLWEPVIVQGWRSINDRLEPTPNFDRDIDWGTAERDTMAAMEIGCSCGWDGVRDQLVELGIDGKPLPSIHPKQISIEEALEK